MASFLKAFAREDLASVTVHGYRSDLSLKCENPTRHRRTRRRGALHLYRN